MADEYGDADRTSVMPAAAPSSSARGAEPPSPPARKGRMDPWMWVAIALLVVLIGGGAAYALGAFSSQPTVPDVTGSTVAAATQTLVAAGYTLGSQLTTASAAIARDLVVSTVPTAGTQLAKGQVVVLVVSTGPAAGVVPDVVGSTEASAVAAVQAAGLTTNVNQGNDSSMKAGLVFKTDPAAGTSVAPQSLVQIFVSTGAPSQSGGTGTEKVTVPDVTGKTQNDAIDALKALGFSVIATMHSSSTVSNGLVISQDPQGGSSHSKGSTVNILVSSGPAAQVTVPNLVGLSTSVASSQLTALGLVPDAHPGDLTHLLSQAGKVEDQVEAAGSKVDVGSNVTFRYYHLVLIKK